MGLASFHLEGDAQLWFLKLERDSPNLTWEVFREFWHFRFGHPIRSNKLGELYKLRQIGVVEEYVGRFEQLSARASSFNNEQEVEFFISGLPEQTSIEVKIHRPKDLTTATGMARLYDRRPGAKRYEFTPSTR